MNDISNFLPCRIFLFCFVKKLLNSENMIFFSNNTDSRSATEIVYGRPIWNQTLMIKHLYSCSGSHNRI